MSLALLFSGQGQQHPAMLPWLESAPAAAPLLAGVVEQFGAGWRQRLAEPDWAQRNAIAQPLLTRLALAAWQALAPLLPAPAAVAGYSLGELAAFSAAGVLPAHDALQLAGERAACMDAAVAGLAGGLLAVQGLDRGAWPAVCAEHGLAVAIIWAADRVVLGGPIDALARAESALTAQGRRCTRLAVQIASHTPWLAAAAAGFEQRLATQAFERPDCALVCNLSGASVREPERLRQALARQIAMPVLWDACMDAVAERRVRCVLEIGAGSALAAGWRERQPDVPARSADEFRSAEAVARWVEQALRA